MLGRQGGRVVTVLMKCVVFSWQLSERVKINAYHTVLVIFLGLPVGLCVCMSLFLYVFASVILYEFVVFVYDLLLGSYCWCNYTTMSVT